MAGHAGWAFIVLVYSAGQMLTCMVYVIYVIYVMYMIYVVAPHTYTTYTFTYLPSSLVAR